MIKMDRSKPSFMLATQLHYELQPVFQNLWSGIHWLTDVHKYDGSGLWFLDHGPHSAQNWYWKVLESLVLTTFIKKIKLSNDRNQEVHLIDNFCRVADTKNLVFNFNEMNARFNHAGRGPVWINDDTKLVAYSGCWWQVFLSRTFVTNIGVVVITFGPFKMNILIFMAITCLSFKAFDLAILIKVSFQTR